MATEFEVGGTRVEIVRGDITAEDVDAIVNAANSSLMGGGGVDGAIHRAGGPAILADCEEIVKRQGQLPPGKAVITTAGDMPARHVIHTVGPFYSGSPEDPETLASCFTESLKVADEHGLRSVSFPAISCGVYGYPHREAAEVSIGAVAAYALDKARDPPAGPARPAPPRPDLKAGGEGKTGVELVRFVLFGPRVHDVFARAADAFAG